MSSSLEPGVARPSHAASRTAAREHPGARRGGVVLGALARRVAATRRCSRSTARATAGASSTARARDARGPERDRHRPVAASTRAGPGQAAPCAGRGADRAPARRRRREGDCSPTSTATATSRARASCPATASRGCRCRRSSRRGAAAKGKDEFLQRPRFLAISEFGPRSIVYHEGSRYLINRVFLPVERDEENRLPTIARQAVLELRLPAPGRARRPRARHVRALRRAARPAAHQRSSGFRTSPRSAVTGSTPTRRSASGRASRSAPASASPKRDGRGQRDRARRQSTAAAWGTLTYGGAATLWRINVGWTRRKNPNRSASSSTPNAATGRRTPRPPSRTARTR